MKLPPFVERTTAIAELKQLLPQCLLPDQVRIGQRLVAALTRLRQGQRIPMPLDRWLAEARASIALRHRRSEIRRRLEYPSELPITAHREAIVDALRRHPVVIVAGETGSGKTTQLPKMCLEAGLGSRARIGCTQPRRVAALSISRRIAEELGVEWGREVGCKIRFADQSRPETSVKVMTDGILLAEVQGDPLLTEYEALLIDEAHERSLNIDFLLGYLKTLIAKRDDLKLVITSATIDTALFARAFDDAPVLEVSGRLHPVEVRYRPLDSTAVEEGDQTYVDAALGAAGELLDETPTGDALVFLPGERDIRELCDDLRARFGERIEVVPLFGRLTAGEQQRVFAPGPRRRVVVATNIAETSLTVPRIRYVVDAGFARVSRYHPGTRSRRLPIEPIAQSSANQRSGRCGRLGPGVCIRLYDEADFRERRPYIEPEIQRCNLADVILRMKAFRLGEIETFPFLEAPSPAAIQGAYGLLEELGALDANRALTDLGHELARLPADPAIGRMVLEARHEQALEEILIIAAGLSIQDPRERPLERQAEAEAAHRRFQDPRSDFLTLLNIWRAYHDTFESLKTQNQLRKFCRSHFLSFVRMREWVDVHAQLSESLGDLGGFAPNARPASYAAIHRSILTGLFGHVAQRTERNTYRLPGNRLVNVFPGSGLFDRGARRNQAKPPTASKANSAAGESPAPEAPPQPEWIVAGELVETSRPYARTVAGVDPEWVIELAPHLCRVTHDQPRWEATAGRVLARERVLLRGLVLRERRVSYARVNPTEATAIFIRSALIGGDLEERCPFVEHNRRLVEKLEVWQTRMRHRVVPDLNEALFDFYASRLKDVASLHDLNRVRRAATEPRFLEATEADLLGEHAAAFDRTGFPDAVQVGPHALPVVYAYAPGEERDGVTLQLTAPIAERVDPGQLDWLVPSLRAERIEQLLRLLPKAQRRPLVPIEATARAILEAVNPAAGSFLVRLSQYLRQHYGIEVRPSDWPLDALPPHLRPRYEIVDRAGRALAAGRDFEGVRARVQRHETEADAQAWKAAVARWERYGLTGWDFGALPEEIVVTDATGSPLSADPALEVENGEVNLRLFRRKAEADAAHARGVRRLAELALKRELAWVQKDLRDLDRLKPLYVTLGPGDELDDTAWEHLIDHLFPRAEPPVRDEAGFAAYVEAARARLPRLGSRLIERIAPILEKRQAGLLCRKPLPQMRRELDALVPSAFLRHIRFEELPALPRYLQALLIRAERAALNPAKDAEKQARVQPYWAALADLRAKAKPGTAAGEAVRRFRWLIEEFKVSCFAQELGTAEPVSPKRLEAALAEARRALEGGG